MSLVLSLKFIIVFMITVFLKRRGFDSKMLRIPRSVLFFEYYYRNIDDTIK